MTCQHGEIVGADLVGGITVGGDPVGADNDGADLAKAHQVTRGTVDHQGDRNVFLLQLPAGQACALHPRTGFAGIDASDFFRRPGGADDAERGAVAASGQCASVAVRIDGAAIRYQRETVLGEAQVHASVFVVHGFCFGGERLDQRGAAGSYGCFHARQGPEQVDRRRPAGREGVQRGCQ